MIKIDNFKKSYSKNIFSNTTVAFSEKCVNFIMGKNGSGKTTLFKCIAGLENYEGSISFDGESINSAREKLFVLWDDTPFYPKLSGLNNVFLFSEGKVHKSDIPDIASEYIDFSLLKKPVKTYSYGQKKKLAIVLLNILKPKFILMDEISNGLDVDTMKVLEKNICELANNSTLILTGHQFSFYQHIVDRVYVKTEEDLVQVAYNKKNNIELEKIYNEKIN